MTDEQLKKSMGMPGELHGRLFKLSQEERRTMLEIFRIMLEEREATPLNQRSPGSSN